MSEYKSTLLVQDNSPKEIQKADLDLLKKINEVGSELTSFEQDVATALKNIRASYTVGSSLSIPSSTETVINFATKTIDTNNIVTIGSDWRATFPIGCNVLIDSGITFDTGSYTAGQAFALIVRRRNKAGVMVDYKKLNYSVVEATVSTYYHICGSVTMTVDKDDYIKISVFQTSGSRNIIADTSECFVNITSIGLV